MSFEYHTSCKGSLGKITSSTILVKQDSDGYDRNIKGHSVFAHDAIIMLEVHIHESSCARRRRLLIEICKYDIIV